MTKVYRFQRSNGRLVNPATLIGCYELALRVRVARLLQRLSDEILHPCRSELVPIPRDLDSQLYTLNNKPHDVVSSRPQEQSGGAGAPETITAIRQIMADDAAIHRMAQFLAEQVSMELGGISLGSVAEAEQLLRDLLLAAVENSI